MRSDDGDVRFNGRDVRFNGGDVCCHRGDVRFSGGDVRFNAGGGTRALYGGAGGMRINEGVRLNRERGTCASM